MIMVDELRVWPGPKPRCFNAGSCHLTTDGPIEELHAFARMLGLRLEWFQDHRLAPHYDLTPKKREWALVIGAVFVPAKVQVRQRRAAMPVPPQSVDTTARASDAHMFDESSEGEP